MALNLESLSITSVYNSIVNFFKSQENNTRWKDLTTGSEGSFLIRLLSNVFSAISYRVVGQSRETYLSTANALSSNIGIAVNLQYSVFRGSNLKRKVQIIPNRDYTYPRLSVIGHYSNNYDIIVLNDVSLEEGKSTEIETVIGKVKEISFTPGTSAIKPFSLFTTGISEDYALYIANGESTDEGVIEVPTTKIMRDMVNDKYLVRTNPYLSVDILYLNTETDFKYKYGTDTEITLRYVELADVPQVPYTTSMFDCGEVENYSTISTYIPMQNVDSIKVNAPLSHDVQCLIRSKADYAKRIKTLVPSIKQVNWDTLTPTYTLITYLKDDLTLITEKESSDIEEVLEEENYFGTPLPDKVNPRRAVAKLQINLALKVKYKNISDIQLDIDNILRNYHDYKLGSTFNTFDFERELENLSYVRYARVSYDVQERKINSNYQIGYTIEYNGNIYRAVQILGQSGVTEPSWVLPEQIEGLKGIDTGMLTQDGSLIWRCYKRLPNIEDITKWKTSYNFGINEYVYTDSCPGYMFKCVDIIKSSGQQMPEIVTLSKGDFVTDGGIVWVLKDYVDAPIWNSYHKYSLGETVNTNSPTYSLECVSYTGTTSTIENPSFEVSEYPITSKGSNYFILSGNQNFYFREGDSIYATYSGGYTNFGVTNVSYNSALNITTINVTPDIPGENYLTLIGKERGTRDYQILWKLVDNITEIKYDWNSYVTYEYDLSITEG